MKYNFKPRLQVYYGLIGRYDFIEKHDLFDLETKNLESLNILWTTNRSTKNNLNLLLLKEFLTCQNFSFQNLTNKKKNNLNYFVITLRNLYLFLYLETLLITYFLFSNIKYSINPKVLFNIHVFIQISYYNIFFNNFSSKFNIQRTIFNDTISFNFLKNKVINLNYYFLPEIRRIA